MRKQGEGGKEKARRRQGEVKEKSRRSQGEVKEKSRRSQGEVKEKSRRSQGEVKEKSRRSQGEVKEKSRRSQGEVKEKSRRSQGEVKEKSRRSQGEVKEKSRRSQGEVKEKSRRSQGEVKEKSRRSQGEVKEKSRRSQGEVKEKSRRSQGEVKEKSRRSQGEVKEKSRRSQGEVKEKSRRSQGEVKEKSRRSQGEVKEKSRRSQGEVKEKSRRRGSRGSVGQYSEGSRSLSVDIELLSHELRELKDFIGVQYERLFIAAKQRHIEDLPKALQLAEEKEQFLERLENPDLIALLKQTFKRAERGSFAPRQFQKRTDYLEILKADSAKFERYLSEIGEAVASIDGVINELGEETPEELIKYKEILEERAQKLNSVNNLLMRYLIQESCLDSYIAELDLARAYAFVKEQSDHIAKLLEYVDLQRKHMDPESPAFGEWSGIDTEKEPLDNKVEERLKTVGELETQYGNQEEDEKDTNLVRLMRKNMEELLRKQSVYIQKLRNCIEAQAPYVYEDDEIPDTTEIAAEGTYISKYVEEWLMFNRMESNNPSKEEGELELLKCLKEELEGFIEDLKSELEEMEEETPEEEESREGLVEWLTNNESKKEYLEKMVQELSDELNTLDKNIQVVERRAIYGDKKALGPKKSRRMPKMSELGSVESLDMPDTVAELKDFCKDLVQKYNCLFKVYTMRMNLNDEKRRQEQLREKIDKVIDSKHARKRGITPRLHTATKAAATLAAQLPDLLLIQQQQFQQQSQFEWRGLLAFDRPQPTASLKLQSMLLLLHSKHGERWTPHQSLLEVCRFHSQGCNSSGATSAWAGGQHFDSLGCGTGGSHQIEGPDHRESGVMMAVRGGRHCQCNSLNCSNGSVDQREGLGIGEGGVAAAVQYGGGGGGGGFGD
ncbi:myosin-9-like [Schistocerca nitens]|uniref:myosin-9-like n=1 Tax=Schistocerca nitens TaxID=7011 RepID=UPI0021178A21|nr:myosin-9-like [Schistocerca nitens]